VLCTYKHFPTDDAALRAPSHGVVSIHPPYEDEITFSIPSRSGFPSLEKSHLSTDEVEEVSSGEVPSFIQDFCAALVRRRVIPENVSAAATSPLFFSHSAHLHSHQFKIHLSRPSLRPFPGLALCSTSIFTASGNKAA
jgi:hypothetical protein